jgi:hypothetical protein
MHGPSGQVGGGATPCRFFELKIEAEATELISERAPQPRRPAATRRRVHDDERARHRLLDWQEYPGLIGPRCPLAYRRPEGSSRTKSATSESGPVDSPPAPWYLVHQFWSGPGARGGTAARGARKATAAESAAIGRALDEFRAKVATGGAGLEEDLRFHLAVAAAAHSPVLRSPIGLLAPDVITSSLTDDVIRRVPAAGD